MADASIESQNNQENGNKEKTELDIYSTLAVIHYSVSWITCTSTF
jgi:hypothetical protein